MAANPIYLIGEEKVKPEYTLEDTAAPPLYESLQLESVQGGRPARENSNRKWRLIVVLIILGMAIMVAIAGYLGWYFGTSTHG